MKRFYPVLALSALAAAATVAMAQQAPPPAEPPASTAPQDQNQTPSPQEQSPDSSTAPSDPNASPSSESRQQTLMKECMTQVAAANPGLAQKDIQNFCDKEVSQTPPQG